MEEQTKAISIIKTPKLKWINVKKTTREQIKYLQDNFDFFALDLKDVLPPLQRPKILQRENYLFMILNFPVYDKKTGIINSTEVDFFIGKDYVITTHENVLVPLQKFEEAILINQQYKKNIFVNSGNLVYEIMELLIESVFPMLNHLSLDIEELEKNALDTEQTESIGKILNIKRNISNFRKIMLGHKAVLRRMINVAPDYFPVAKLTKFFDNLVEQTKDVWDTLENYKETIDALHETKESILSFRLNQIMKTLTIFSVIILPLSLIAGIFGMNTVHAMPFMNNDWGFIWIMTLMFFCVGVMLLIFKKKKWL